MTSTSPAPPADQTTQLAILCVGAFLSALNFFATSPFYPQIARDLDTTVPLLGQAITLMLLVSAALGLAVGPLADAHGYRKLLVIGLVAIGMNMLGIAVAPNYATLLGLSLVGAFGDALVFGLTLALAATLFAETARRRAISWTIASLSVGAIAGVPFLTMIASVTGWRVAIATVGVGSLAAAWLTLSGLPADRPSNARIDMRSLLRAYSPLRGAAPTLRLYAITVARAIWFLGAVTYLGAYLGDELGLTTGEIGLAYLLGGAGSTAGNLLAGTRFVDASARTLIAGASITGGLLMAGIFRAPQAMLALALLPLASILAGMVGVGIATLLAATSPIPAGATMTLNASLLNAGGAVGATLGGGLIAIGGYGLIGLVFPVFALACAMLILWPGRIGEPDRTRHRTSND